MILDIRTPLTMRLVSEVLLQIAENPLDSSDGTSIGNTARLARQASASVVLNCASELWSATVANLLALEPEFPLSEDVTEFIDESRMPWMSYLSCVYKMCKCTFKGTHSYEKAKTIIDLRHALIHDKPEPYDNLNEAVLDRWRRRLEPLVGEDAIEWLPCVGYMAEEDEGEASYYADGSEPTIMKVMKYPIAKWTFDATAELCDEMSGIVRQHPGQKRLIKVAASTCGPDLLWQSGKLVRRTTV